MIGGYGQTAGGCNTKTFTGLTAHSAMRVTLSYHFLDSWDFEVGSLQVDGAAKWTLTHRLNAASGNVCGNATFGDYLNYPVDVEFAHSGSTATIAVCSNLDEASTNESFGFSDLTVRLR
jgi:hypothetical protein